MGKVEKRTQRLHAGAVSQLQERAEAQLEVGRCLLTSTGWPTARCGEASERVRHVGSACVRPPSARRESDACLGRVAPCARCDGGRRRVVTARSQKRTQMDVDQAPCVDADADDVPAVSTSDDVRPLVLLDDSPAFADDDAVAAHCDDDVQVEPPQRQELPCPGVRPAGTTPRKEDSKLSRRQRLNLLDGGSASSSEDTGDEVYAAHVAALRKQGLYFQPVADDYADGTLRRSARRSARPEAGFGAESGDSDLDAAAGEAGRSSWYARVADTERHWRGATVERVAPSSVSEETLRIHGFAIPYLISDGTAHGTSAALQLGMRLPPASLTVADVADGVGHEVAIPTIDVATQRDGPRMTVAQFAAYWEQRGRATTRRRGKLLNCVSLSLAGTALAEWVEPPAVVRSLDLLAEVWPQAAPQPGDGDVAQAAARPEVLLYALMSPGGSFTDCHVDFGGSSVWYHLLSGTKVFLLAPPTEGNLAAFQAWASSPAQARTYLMDSLSWVHRAQVGPGDTLLIPGGWIHCVSTPSDAIALGGNFLHLLNLRVACRVADIELQLGVPPQARFPGFAHAMWYFASKFGTDGTATKNPWVQRSALAVLRALRAWRQEGPGSVHAPPPDLEHCVDDVIAQLEGATKSAATLDDDETAEAEARLQAAAQAGGLGAQLTLRGGDAVRTRVSVLRGGRRGERWATGVLVAFDPASRCFDVVFDGKKGQQGGEDSSQGERLALHECTLRDPDGTNSHARPAARLLRVTRPPRRTLDASPVAAAAPAPAAPTAWWEIGSTVWRHWPDDGGWFKALVVSHDAAKGQWELVYDRGSEIEETEWADLTEMGPDELCKRRPPHLRAAPPPRRQAAPAGGVSAPSPDDSSSSDDAASDSGDGGDAPDDEPRPVKRHAAPPRPRPRGGLGMGGPRTAAVRPPPAPSPATAPPAAVAAQAVVPARATVSALMRQGLRQEALALATAHGSHTPGATEKTAPQHISDAQSLSPALRAFLTDSARVDMPATGTMQWAAVMKHVLDYVRTHALRHGGGGAVRCDAPLELLLGKSTVAAAELSTLVRRHFGVAVNLKPRARMISEPFAWPQLPLPPPPPPPPPRLPPQYHPSPFLSAIVQAEYPLPAYVAALPPPPAPPPLRPVVHSDWDDLAEWVPPSVQHPQQHSQQYQPASPLQQQVQWPQAPEMWGAYPPAAYPPAHMQMGHGPLPTHGGPPGMFMAPQPPQQQQQMYQPMPGFMPPPPMPHGMMLPHGYLQGPWHGVPPPQPQWR